MSRLFQLKHVETLFYCSLSLVHLPRPRTKEAHSFPKVQWSHVKRIYNPKRLRAVRTWYMLRLTIVLLSSWVPSNVCPCFICVFHPAPALSGTKELSRAVVVCQEFWAAMAAFQQILPLNRELVGGSWNAGTWKGTLGMCKVRKKG